MASIMDSSIYYDGREDGDSPLLTPLTPNFDRYISRGVVDDSPYFPDSTYAAIKNDSYSMDAPQSSLGRRGSSGFALDFLPTGDTMPRPYPGTIDPSVASPNRTWDMNSTSPVLYPDRDSSEEVRLRAQQYGNSFDGYSNEGYRGFLPSPPDAGDACDNASRGPPRKKTSTSEKKKRKSSSAKDKDDEASRPAAQLRTASRAPKRYSQSTTRRPAESVEEVKARAAHNQVEQQYRKRLNQQFERLLAVLPQPDYDEEGDDAEMADGGSGKGPTDKRISKAEVLDLARRRIRVLEKERATLERQKKELAASVVRLQEEWTRRLGSGVPVKAEAERE